jgi:hypothetical protein
MDPYKCHDVRVKVCRKYYEFALNIFLAWLYVKWLLLVIQNENCCDIHTGNSSHLPFCKYIISHIRVII